MTQPGPVPHVLLTRFNLPANRVERSIFSPEWLEERMGLFETYTVPSVRAQVQDGLSWVVYLDKEFTPGWLRARMAELQAELPLHPTYIDRALSREMIRADVMRASGRTEGAVVTSNLDNDDGLASAYVHRIRALVPATTPAAMYLTDGLILHRDQVYVRRDEDNAFAAVVDDVSSSSFLTCWAAVHHELGSLMPVVRAGGAPGWLQVVHGRNVSNRVAGRLAAPSRYAGVFPGLIDDVPPLTVRARVRDAVVRPARAVRDRVVRPAAALVRKVAGPERYETIKMAIQRHQ